jgi:uncharacterized protein YcbX
MLGEQLELAEFGSMGMVGDRAYAIVDPETGKVASAKNPKKWPRLFECQADYLQAPTNGSIPAVRVTLPDGNAMTGDSPQLTGAITALLGRPGVLQHAVPERPVLEEYWPDMEELDHQDEVTDEAMPEGTFFDCAPVHVLTTGTLDSLRAVYASGLFDVRRFRPNILIETPADAGPFPESDWVGRTLTIGEIQLRITNHCGRCVMTTLPQPGIPRDPGILRAAAQHNSAHVGVYAEVIKGGATRLGDTATLS